MSTILFSRSATCFFSPRGCCTIVTYSPMIALPSASISRLKPNGASSAARRPHRDEREVALVVGEEEAVGVERQQRDVERPAVDAVLEVELDHAAARRLGVGQHVVVGQQQRGGDERAGAEADVAADRVADVHAADRPRGGHAGVEVADADEVRGDDDLLEQLLRARRRWRPPGRRSSALSRSTRLAMRSGVSAAARPPGPASAAACSWRHSVRSSTRLAAASRWRSRSCS